jgi:hypothetical protein
MPTGPDDVRFQEKTGSSRPNPISLHGGNQLATLEDAARLIQRLPKAEQRRNSSASALTIP